MASTLALNEVWRCQVACYAGNQLAENNYDYKVTAVSGASATDVLLCSALNTIVAPFYRGLMNVNAVFWGVKTYRLLPKAASIPITNATLNGAGSLGGAGSLVPTDNAAIGTRYSAVYGKGRKGRVFMPFLDTSQINANLLTNAAQAAFQTFQADVYPTSITVGAGANTAVVVPVVWSKKYLTGNVVVNYYTDLLLGQQKKRGPRGRLNIVPPW